LLQSDISSQYSDLPKPVLYSFQSKATGQFSNSKTLEIGHNEKVEQISYIFEKGLKYLSIKTEQQEVEWGIKNEDAEVSVLKIDQKEETDSIGSLGPLRFGFSLNANKFGALNFVVY
jgi:hypothetical protein